MGLYRISQLTERTGVPATTLRFYEQQGLLPAQRSPAGYRLYDDSAVDRLGFIGAGKHLGLPLEEIRELLGVWESGLCVQVQDRLRPLLRAGLHGRAALPRRYDTDHRSDHVPQRRRTTPVPSATRPTTAASCPEARRSATAS